MLNALLKVLILWSIGFGDKLPERLPLYKTHMFHPIVHLSAEHRQGCWVGRIYQDLLLDADKPRKWCNHLDPRLLVIGPFTALLILTVEVPGAF